MSARDSAGGIALHAATLRRHVDVARVLLEAGSDCNAIDQGNNTPLHMLASASTGDGGGCGGVGEGTGDSELVALLLEWGASADVKNSKGLTPMSAALDTRNRATVLAYRAFFGEDSGLPLDVESASGSIVPEIVAGTVPLARTIGGHKETEEAMTVGAPDRGRKAVSA